MIRQQTLLGTLRKHNEDVQKLVDIICDCVWENVDEKTTAVIFTPPTTAEKERDTAAP